MSALGPLEGGRAVGWLLKPCPGRLGGRENLAPHSSHEMRIEPSGLIWCNLCGAWARERIRNLRLECHGQPWSVASRFSLRRLRAGRGPLEPLEEEQVVEQLVIAGLDIELEVV